MFTLFAKKPATPAITPEELAAFLTEEQPPVLVDIRSSDEYARAHIPGAIHIPFDELQERAHALDPSALTVFY